MKRCLYCQGFYPEDQFVLLSKGRGGRVKVSQCIPCHTARQNPEANKKRLEEIIASNKEANRRAFRPLGKEKVR